MFDIRSIFSRSKVEEKPRQKLTTGSGRVLAGKRARISADTSEDPLFGNMMYVSPPPDANSAWRVHTLDDQTLDRISPAKLIELMVDVSPEISKAFWDFLRFCNPGWQIEAKTGDKQNEAGQKALLAMIDILDELYGDTNVVVNRLFIGAFMRGAFMGELVLDQQGREFADLATPDPLTARFRKGKDEIRGMVWKLGQWQSGQWVDLSEIETIRYIPIDPLPGGPPYGRSLVNPAIFSALFLIGLLHDLRRVVAQQGYPRLDLEVDLEQLTAAMPENLDNEPDKVQEWVQGVIDEIAKVYAGLEPDDAYVHTSVIKVNRPVGAVDSSSLGAIDGLIKGLERMATRALKSMPLLMGSNEAVSETHANRQWEIHVAGIKSLQHYCEKLLERLFQLALQAQGIQAEVNFTFAELRASEMLRDAQTEAIQISNAKQKYDNGWVSQDEASEEITGSPADVPEPRTSQATMTELMWGDGEGEERGTRVKIRRINRPAFRAVQISPEGSEQPLPELPSDIIINERDIELALARWDELMPDYEGLLEAAVLGRQDFEDEDDRFLQVYENEIGERLTLRAGGDVALWVWNQSTKRYRHTETGQFIGQRRMVELRDEFTALQKARLIEEAVHEGLLTGETTVQRWLLRQREIVKQTFVDQYVMAKGGRNNMTASDWGRIGRMLRPQYDRLQAFAEAIADGELSMAQIRNRASMYIDASTQAFERGKAASYGDFTLPAHPADGQTQCRARCRCQWVIRETNDAWECTWKIDSAAENCEDCQDNAAKWNPLVIYKDEARNRQQLAGVLERVQNGG